MSGTLGRTTALAVSTTRDIVRRPGGIVALLITGALLLLLPRLARRALDDGAALGVELVLSTLALHAILLGGLVAVHAGSSGSALGPVPEFLTTPLRWGEYVVARVVGVLGGAAVHVTILTAVAVLAILAAGEIPETGAGTLVAGMISIAIQALLFTTAGICAGALLGAEMGTVAVLALLIGSRLVIPALTESGAAWTWLLPDPSRIDLAREVALGRPLGTATWPVLWGASLLQAAGLLLAAHWRLSARSTTGG